jgi:type IX secretion system PorP/SprF family membrane protein
MKKLISFYILIFLTISVKGQQVPIFSQYMFNKFLLNPALAGAEGYTSCTITSRLQWAGFKDAPVTNSINAQTRLTKKSSGKKVSQFSDNYGKTGIGINIYDDHRGLLAQTGVEFTYAYHTKIAEKAQLSFGLTYSMTNFRLDKSKLQLNEPDNYLTMNNLSLWIMDLNAGVYLTTQKAYLGFSANRILPDYLIPSSTLGMGNPEYVEMKLKRNYNLMAGYRFALDKNWGIEPSCFFKTTDQIRLSQIDLSCRTYYKRDFWLGFGVRSGNALTANMGVRWNNIYFGYGYDFTLNKLQTYSAGTHEFIITFKIGQNVWKYKWLERF